MSSESDVLDPQHWESQYQDGNLPWETGRPSGELQRVIQGYGIRPCRAIEFGCGTGCSAVWLAQQGFEVTAVDLSTLAIQQARRRAAAAGVTVDFQVGDLLALDAFDGSFDFFFDGGCYHAVRRANGPAYLAAVRRLTSPQALGLILTGNAAQPEDESGPPVLNEQELRAEWGQGFHVRHLRSFCFETPEEGAKQYLGWSCFVQREE